MEREVSIFNKLDAAATTGQIAAHLFDFDGASIVFVFIDAFAYGEFECT